VKRNPIQSLVGARCIVLALACLLIIGFPVGATKADPQFTVRPNAEHHVGLLARNNDQADESEFSPLIDYLNDQLPDFRFSLIPLSFDRMQDAINRKQIEFIIANPINFVEMEEPFDLRAIATLRRQYQGGSLTEFGGVVFGLANGPATERFEDLRGKRICAVSQRSFGGMRMQMRELAEAGVSERDLHIEYASSHNAVIDRVLNKKCDFGFVRTGALENYCYTHGMEMSQFKVFAPRILSSFPYAVSTRLYPEWPFAALPLAHEQTVSKVASALLAMPPYTNPLSGSEVLSWAPPSSYKSVRLLAAHSSVGLNHNYAEALSFGLLSLLFVVILVVAAELGRRRRSVSLNPGNFFPCVIACLSTTVAAIVILLLIGSAERTTEALLRAQFERSYLLNVAMGIAAFVCMALAMHAICRKATHRDETFLKLEELLEGFRNGTTSWDTVEDYCRANQVTEDEFDSVESRILAARKAKPEPRLVNLTKHHEKWVLTSQAGSNQNV